MCSGAAAPDTARTELEHVGGVAARGEVGVEATTNAANKLVMASA
jgi:hypothetical protein